MAERWIRDNDVIATDLDDEIVLLNPATRAVFTLNPTGREIWNCIAGPATVAEIVTALTARFAVDEEKATRDVRAVLDDLAASGLVRGP
jgi:PqqD family protein of HPr-rel-A system